MCCALDSGGPGLGLGLVLWLALELGFVAAELELRIALALPPPLVAFRAVSSCCRAAWACCRSNWSCIWSCWSWEAEGPELSWPPAERRTPDNWDRSSGGTGRRGDVRYDHKVGRPVTQAALKKVKLFTLFITKNLQNCHPSNGLEEPPILPDL